MLKFQSSVFDVANSLLAVDTALGMPRDRITIELNNRTTVIRGWRRFWTGSSGIDSVLTATSARTTLSSIPFDILNRIGCWRFRDSGKRCDLIRMLRAAAPKSCDCNETANNAMQALRLSGAKDANIEWGPESSPDNSSEVETT